MTVQVVYKNKANSSNSGVIALFVDEKFQIKINLKLLMDMEILRRLPKDYIIKQINLFNNYD